MHTLAKISHVRFCTLYEFNTWMQCTVYTPQSQYLVEGPLQQIQLNDFLVALHKAADFDTWIWRSSPIPLWTTVRAGRGYLVFSDGQQPSVHSIDTQLGYDLAIPEHPAWGSKRIHGSFWPLGHCPVEIWNFLFILRSFTNFITSFLGISLCLASSVHPSLLISSSGPLDENHPHTIMLPPPCFTVVMLMFYWWTVLSFMRKSSTLPIEPLLSVLQDPVGLFLQTSCFTSD